MNFLINMFFVLLATMSATRVVTKRSNCTGHRAVEVLIQQPAKKAFLSKFPATVLAEVGEGYHQAPAYHLAPPGATKCDFGETVPQGQCQAVGKSLVPAGKTPGRGLQVGSGGSCGDGGWGNVPKGCSIQSGGDYAPHFKSNDIGCASYSKGYQLVCTGAPPAAAEAPTAALPGPAEPMLDECASTMEIVLTVNKVMEEATDVEKKAEKAETEAKMLSETVAEVKAAKAKVQSTAAEQVAMSTAVEALKDEVKKEVEEIKEKKEIIKADKVEAAKVVQPEAKAAVQESEEVVKQELVEEEIEAKNKDDEKIAAEKESMAKVMESVEAQADTAAKEDKFQMEEEALKEETPLIDGEKTFKIKMEAVGVQNDLAKVPPPPPTAKKTAAEEIKTAEVHKIQIAIKLTETAEKEAKAAKVEQKKADVVMQEVTAEADKQEDTSSTIDASMDTIEKLQTSVEAECKPCKKKKKKSWASRLLR